MNAIEWTRISNDVNGNPRVVCSFLNLNTEAELNATGANWIPVHVKYQLALGRARQIGGRKYNTKAYGGGIVFSGYSIPEIEKDITRVLDGTRP